MHLYTQATDFDLETIFWGVGDVPEAGEAKSLDGYASEDAEDCEQKECEKIGGNDDAKDSLNGGKRHLQFLSMGNEREFPMQFRSQERMVAARRWAVSAFSDSYVLSS